jgi:hypothetical protein
LQEVTKVIVSEASDLGLADVEIQSFRKGTIPRSFRLAQSLQRCGKSAVACTRFRALDTSGAEARNKK